MAAPVNAPLPTEVDLGAGWTISFAALNASTGNAQSGVVVSNATLLVASIDSEPPLPQTDNTPPLFVPVPVDSSPP